jgi:IS5 family transposase
LLAPAQRLDGRWLVGRDLGGGLGGTGCRRRARNGRAVRRRDLRPGPKRGFEIGKTKVGKGCKIEIVTDANGIPIGAATAAANIPETDLIGPALNSIPEDVELPHGVPVISDKAYDSDPLRRELAAAGFTLLSPHRSNRVKPATNDGRRMRRYDRRWKIERTISWLHSFRRLLVRQEYYSFIFDGFVHLGLALICLSKF